MTERQTAAGPGAPRLPEGRRRRRASAPRCSPPPMSAARRPVLRFQSTWPQRDIFHEFAQDYVTPRQRHGAAGACGSSCWPPGAVVGAFQLLDAVSPARSMAAMASRPTGSARTRPSACSAPPRPGSATPTSCSAGSTTAAARRSTTSCCTTSCGSTRWASMTGPMPTQPLGWFSNAIERAEQIRGLKLPHRGPRDRPVQRDGRGRRRAAGRRDRARARARRHRRRRVQQPLLRPRARLPGRGARTT